MWRLFILMWEECYEFSAPHLWRDESLSVHIVVMKNYWKRWLLAAAAGPTSGKIHDPGRQSTWFWWHFQVLFLLEQGTVLYTATFHVLPVTALKAECERCVTAGSQLEPLETMYAQNPWFQLWPWMSHDFLMPHSRLTLVKQRLKNKTNPQPSCAWEKESPIFSSVDTETILPLYIFIQTFFFQTLLNHLNAKHRVCSPSGLWDPHYVA